MKVHHLLGMVATVWMAASPALSGSELQQLRALVAEQERQIRMLEEENARLRIDIAPRGSRSIATPESQTVTSQNPSAAAPRASATPAPAATGRTHTVAAGDNLVRIGRQFGVSAEAIARENRIGADMIIHPGQVLKIPSNGTTPEPAPAPTASAAPTEPTRTHTVAAGDTFYRIAQQYQVTVERLMAANPDTKPSALRVGQSIRIPATNSTARTSSAQSTPTAPAPIMNPAPTSTPVANATPPEPRPTAANRRQVRTITITGEMSYGAFAEAHGTTTERLNQLNGLDLDARTVLAKGSELYVPAGL